LKSKLLETQTDELKSENQKLKADLEVLKNELSSSNQSGGMESLKLKNKFLLEKLEDQVFTNNFSNFSPLSFSLLYLSGKENLISGAVKKINSID